MTHTIAPPTLEELNEKISALEEGKLSWGKYSHRLRSIDIELYCLYAVRDGLHVDARQVVCEEWHKAFKEFSLHSGTHTETVIGRIINRLDNISTQSPWMDIETAPKNNNDIWLGAKDRVVKGWWSDKLNSWNNTVLMEKIEWEPTHWQPVIVLPTPAPPTQNSPQE